MQLLPFLIATFATSAVAKSNYDTCYEKDYGAVILSAVDKFCQKQDILAPSDYTEYITFPLSRHSRHPSIQRPLS